jgi:hydroxymethylpyrimidine/phosphomethylpyrimidine kinase
VEAQIDAVAHRGVHATKIAGLYDRTLVDTLAERLRRRRLGAVVLDPGIIDPRGERVLGRKGVDWLRKQLLPRVTVVVLRAAELAILAGAGGDDPDPVAASIRQIRRISPAAVLAEALAPSGTGFWLGDAAGVRLLETPVPAGVGERDRFTAALAVRLAMKDDVAAACRAARQLVED